jgi:Zn-dependent peptidase ImmA (M78 family)
MGTKGARNKISVKKDEPTLLGNVEDIIKRMNEEGFVIDGRVNIEDYIRKEGITIHYDEDLSSSQSGYLKKGDSNWIIGVNSKHNKKRQRFTMAHEYAHFILHKPDKIYFEDEIFFRDSNITSIEYAANEFASKILMLEDFIRATVAEGKTSLEKLAEDLDVSVLAIKNRVISLGYRLKNGE